MRYHRDHGSTRGGLPPNCRFPLFSTAWCGVRKRRRAPHNLAESGKLNEMLANDETRSVVSQNEFLEVELRGLEVLGP